MKKLKRYPLKKREDNRGWLIQCDDKNIAKHMKHFVISSSKPDAIRGNHYHKKKREWFTILQGKAKLYLYDLTTEKHSTYLVSEKHLELIEMAPFVVHAIKNIGKKEMIFFGVVDEIFDSASPDTYIYELIK